MRRFLREVLTASSGGSKQRVSQPNCPSCIAAQHSSTTAQLTFLLLAILNSDRLHLYILLLLLSLDLLHVLILLLYRLLLWLLRLSGLCLGSRARATTLALVSLGSAIRGSLFEHVLDAGLLLGPSALLGAAWLVEELAAWGEARCEGQLTERGAVGLERGRYSRDGLILGHRCVVWGIGLTRCVIEWKGDEERKAE